jgi:hypothetical protein
MNPSCRACKNVLISETASTKLRCGLAYFSTPAKDRRMQRMETYPEVSSEISCEAFLCATSTLREDDELKH